MKHHVDRISRRSFLAGCCSLLPAFRVRSEAVQLFEKMWRGHPMGDGPGLGERWPCKNMLNIDCLSDPDNLTRDQCAIRLGIAIKAAVPGLRLNDFPKLKNSPLEQTEKWPLVCKDLCLPDCAHPEDSLHFLRTSELASCLLAVSSSQIEHPHFSWLGPPEMFQDHRERSRFRSEIGMRNGIIFIENFWDERYQAMRGSHIDLWDGQIKLSKNELYYRGNGRPDGRYEEVADRIIFWEVRG